MTTHEINGAMCESIGSFRVILGAICGRCGAGCEVFQAPEAGDATYIIECECDGRQASIIAALVPIEMEMGEPEPEPAPARPRLKLVP